MRYKIFDQTNTHINTIVADEAFVKTYCQANNYTYEEEIIEKPAVAETEPTDPEPTELEQLRADVDYIAVMTGVEL